MAKKNELEKQEKQEVETPEGVERLTPNKIYAPKVDIYETDADIHVVADMPGVDDKSVDVTLEKNILTIRGTVEASKPEGYDLVYSEYGVGDYERAFTLSDEVDRDKISAAVRDGVLSITLPKAGPDTRKIAVSGA